MINWNLFFADPTLIDFLILFLSVIIESIICIEIRKIKNKIKSLEQKA